MPLTIPEINSMAKWFTRTIRTQDSWEDFAQEAHLILLQKKEQIEAITDNKKSYAAKIVWNHWKKSRPKLIYTDSTYLERETYQVSGLFYELAIQHLEVMLSMRARIVLRELVSPSEKLKELLHMAKLRKRRVQAKPVVPILTAVSQAVNFKISEFVKEICEAGSEVVSCLCARKLQPID